METQIIGEGFHSGRSVSKAIEESKSFGHLAQNWKKFGVELEIAEIELIELERKLNDPTNRIGQLPREIIQIYIANKGKKATLHALNQALKNCGSSDIAEELSAKLAKSLPSFRLLHNDYSVQGLIGTNTSGTRNQEIYERVKKRICTNTPIPLIMKKYSPTKEIIYIPRIFSLKTELDVLIFKDICTNDHIFVVEGASRLDLRKVSGSNEIQSSRNQLHKTTARFFTLDCKEDFKRICKTTKKPVHLIKYRKNGFFWLKSTQSFEKIRVFFKENAELLKEDEAAERIVSLESSCVLSIAGSPGMGKTFVLANLAWKVGEKDSKAIVLFISLPEFVTSIYSMRLNTYDLNLKTIFHNTSADYTAELILREMWENGAYRVYLFFDGYDQVSQEHLYLVDLLFQQLDGEKNVKIIVTTRGHWKSHLEDVFKTISFEILPFKKEQQKEFLTKFWITKNGARDCEGLNDFAENCLATLEVTMSDMEKSLTAVPQKCLLLAEIYAENAVRGLEETEVPVNEIQEQSLLHISKCFIDAKFSNISDPQTRQVYRNMHAYESIALLFSDWVEKFNLTRSDDIDENTLYSIGLLEKNFRLGKPRFIHRTMTDYVLADFITEKINTRSIYGQFILQHILGKLGVFRERRWRQPTLYKLKHPLITYFVNMQLMDFFKNNDMNFLHRLNLSAITEEDVCIAINASCSNDLEACFDLAANMIQRLGIKNKPEIKDKYLKHLLHITVENTKSHEFVKKVAQFMESEFEVSLAHHVYQGRYRFDSLLHIDNCTPLHIAVYQGKFDIIVYYLLDKYMEEQCIGSIKHLLHCCVYKSVENSASVVEDKLSIIPRLVEKNKKWVEEEFEGRNLIMQYNVHIEILDELGKLGLSINSRTPNDGTVLHLNEACDENACMALLRWTLNNGFQLINEKDCLGKTPLMHTISKIGTLNDDLLQLLRTRNIDFLAQDHEGDSILFYALEVSSSPYFVKKLLDYGADPNHKNQKGQNAADIIIQLHRHDPTKILDLLEVLVSSGFAGFNQNASSREFRLILSELRNESYIVQPEALILFLETASKKLMKMVTQFCFMLFGFAEMSI